MNTNFVKVVGSLFAGYILVKLYKKVKYIEKAVHNIDVNVCDHINETRKEEKQVTPCEQKEEVKTESSETKENNQESTKIDENILELNKFLDSFINDAFKKKLGEEEK